ncbi:MAG: class I SAM-dependent methyltransferase [Nitrospirae bacterium]|nr:class I SAM-dependent methyltransferase [Nitrospirota bacterium]
MPEYHGTVSANGFWDGLVGPVDGTPLMYSDGKLTAASGKTYSITDGIANLMDESLFDDHLRHELEVFESPKVKNVCYFQQSLFDEVMSIIKSFFHEENNLSCVEIGGGEGYFAGAFKESFPEGVSSVCDISLQYLKTAPQNLRRIMCDARHPYLDRDTVDVAAFWVSLHHFMQNDMSMAITQAANILKRNGILLCFEPNSHFFPRRLLSATSALKKLVYKDEDEEAFYVSQLDRVLTPLGFKMVFLTVHNPPYNPEFFRQVSGGSVFFPVTQGFYSLERLLKAGQQWWDVKHSKLLPYLGSYFLSVYRRTDDL